MSLPSPYQNFFNKIEDYLFNKNSPIVTITSGTESHRYNKIIRILQNYQHQFLNIFKYRQWKHQNDELINSIFNHNSQFAISTFKRLKSVQNTYLELVAVLRKNVNSSQSKKIETDNIIQHIEQAFAKLKKYQQIIKKIGQYPFEHNIDLFNKIINAEGLLSAKQSLQNICSFKNTILLIDKCIQSNSIKKIHYSYSKKVQQLLAERLIIPLQQLLENYRNIKDCLPQIKKYNTQGLLKCLQKKYEQPVMKHLKEIGQEQKIMLDIIEKIKQQTKGILSISNYPHQIIKSQNQVNKSLIQVSKKMQVIEQIFQSYHQFIKNIISLQGISLNLQKYNQNQTRILVTKKKNWKRQLQSCLNIIIDLCNSQAKKQIKKQRQNNQCRQLPQNVQQRLKTTQIKSLKQELHLSKSQLSQTIKKNYQLSKKMSIAIDTIKQIVKLLNIEIQYQVRQEEFITIAQQLIINQIKKLQLNKQANDQLNLELEKAYQKNKQSQKQKQFMQQKLKLALQNQKYMKQHHNSLIKDREKHDSQQMKIYKQLRQQYSKIQSQKSMLKQQLLRLQKASRQISAQQTVQINPFQQQQFIQQLENTLKKNLDQKTEQFYRNVDVSFKEYLLKLKRIEQKIKECETMIAFKKDKDKQLKEELDQTRRENSIREINQQEENLKMNNLINQLAKNKQVLSQLNRKISQQQRIIRNLECDLQIEKETVKNLNLEVERYTLQLEMMESNSGNHNQESIKNIYEDTIQKMKLQQDNLTKRLQKNELDIVELKKKLLFIESEKLKVADELKRQTKINEEMSQKLTIEEKRKKIFQNQQSFDRISQQHQAQFKAHKQNLRTLYITKYNPQNQQQTSSVYLAYIDKLFQGEILQDLIQYKYRILFHLRKITTNKVQKSKLIYKMDKLNPTNFHMYMDGAINMLSIVRTQKGMILVGFYLGTYGQLQMTQPGILISVNKNESYVLKEPVNSKKFRGMVYDSYYIIYGNAELRIRGGDHSFFSNFGISNSYYNSRNARLIDFVGQDNHDIDIESYEVYSIQFQEEDRWE